jgi:hypothetical protein
MNFKDLNIVSNELIQEKLKAESNIEHLILDKNLNPEEKIKSIIKELGRLKDASLMITYWESFISNNLITPKNEGENNNE